jgi:hypothetical protein
MATDFSGLASCQLVIRNDNENNPVRAISAQLGEFRRLNLFYITLIV